MTTVAAIVASSTVPPEEQAVLVAALVAREDTIAEQLRALGQQFGLYPEIVAESLAAVGIGTPLDDATRAYINRQFVELMDRLRQQQPPPPPPDATV